MRRYVQALKDDSTLEQEGARCELSRVRWELGQMQGEMLQAQVDEHWAAITGSIKAAAEQTVGRLVLDTHTPRDFWTKELETERAKLEKEVDEAQALLLDILESQQRQPSAQEAMKQVNTNARVYRANLQKRSTERFRTTVDKLAHPSNTGAFMRMVKGPLGRQNGGRCQLDKSKVDTYVHHFESTFGGAPNGLRLSPEVPSVPALVEVQVGVAVNRRTVLETIGKLPAGKAWGADDIPAEFLQRGSTALLNTLVAFLSLVYISATVPSVWRTALVVPVWKKKGSAQDIANYHPISLTCVGRRLYERLILPDVKHMEHLLADAQGGFRPHRGTEHQALSLHEAIAGNLQAKVALLDLHAAYDLADRERLWDNLARRYGAPLGLLNQLRDLFDHNVTNLMVGGARSADLPNCRGVLQGSSLSPILFNFLINELALELQADLAGVLVFGKRINSLLFADDTALIAATTPQLASLLAICEQWSQRAGMEFSPAKCFCFAPHPPFRQTPLQLYGVDLPSVTTATYLGFPFTPLGIDFAELCRSRCEKAKGIISALKGIGFNITGWAPAAAARVFTTFVRPTMEYGVALRLPTPKLALIYQRTQNLALRTMCSATASTSVAALHRLTCIQPFAERCKELNMLSAARFHNSNDASTIGVQLWRRAVGWQQPPPKSSLPMHSLTQNPLLVVARALLLDHTANPLVHTNPTRAPPPITPLERHTSRVAQLQQLGQKDNGVGASVVVLPSGRPHHMLTAASPVTRPDCVSLTRWQLGLVASHQQCTKCHGDLSRMHAVVCAGVAGQLDKLVAGVPLELRYGQTGIDILLNAGAEFGLTKRGAGIIAGIISEVERVCRGRERTEQGFWVQRQGGAGGRVGVPPTPPY